MDTLPCIRLVFALSMFGPWIAQLQSINRDIHAAASVENFGEEHGIFVRHCTPTCCGVHIPAVIVKAIEWAQEK